MAKQKSVREKGKIKFSNYFKILNDGDVVAVVKDLSISSSFPKRIQGKTGVIESRRGKAYIVKIQDFNQEKRFIIEAIHLKKLNKDNKENKKAKK